MCAFLLEAGYDYVYELRLRRQKYMKENDLVQLLDSYMGNDGYYIKPNRYEL